MVLIEPVNKLQCCIALCVLFCFTHGFDLLGFFVISHGGLASKHCGAGQKLLPCLPRLGARRVRIQSLQRLRWLHKCVVIILVCSLFCEGIFGASACMQRPTSQSSQHLRQDTWLHLLFDSKVSVDRLGLA